MERARVDVLELKEWPAHSGEFIGSQYDLVLLGTPTYGAGDWHYLWALHGEDVCSRFDSGQTVALFALGDSRGHAESFAGGLARLYEICVRKGFGCVGAINARSFRFEHSPALVGDRFPGLVLEYRREYRAAPAIVSRWAASISDAVMGNALEAD
jgi:flavodoxin I